MTESIDFLKLYQELGLTATCSLDELKHAYRRRIAALHPDRNRGQPGDPASAERLQQLTMLYGAAMDFHRRHRRLPGAVQGATPAPMSRGVGTRSSPHAAVPAAAPERGPYSRLLIVALLLGVIGWALWEFAADEGEHAAPSSSAVPITLRPGATRVAGELVPGMDVASVRAIQGEPVYVASPERWEYGPSYVEFQHGKLVDWYSSPLRPLKVSTPRPPPPKPERAASGHAI